MLRMRPNGHGKPNLQGMSNAQGRPKGHPEALEAGQTFFFLLRRLGGNKKNITLGFANKCNWIIQQIRHRLPPENLKQLDYELKDSLFLDLIETEILKFNEEQRNVLENIVLLINKGEEIKIIEQNN